ncbi:MAG: HmuY family protein [Bacteroidota bacterium]
MRTHRFYMLAAAFMLGLSPAVAQSTDTTAVDHAADHATAETMAADDNIIVVKDVDARSNTPAYFSLRTNSLVDAAQKDTDAWDLSFAGTAVRLNPNAMGALVDVAFDEVFTVYEDELKQDSDGDLVIPGGSDQGWYSYDFMTHSVAPVPGRTLLVQTPEGTFAKVEFLSYYQGEIDDPNVIGDPRFYSFRYTLLPEGETSF